MKVMIITNSFAREVHELVRYAARSGADIAFSLIMPERPERCPASVAVLTPLLASRIRTMLYSPSALFQAFHSFRPDIVHVFEEYSGWLAFECAALRKLLCPSAKLMVYSAENLRQNIHPLFSPTTRYVMKTTDLAFVCSNSVKDTLRAEGFSRPISVFPLGVDTTLFCKRPAQELKRQLGLDRKFVIGYVGRIMRMKGVFLLLDAMRQLPAHVHLLMVGQGEDEARFRQEAEASGLRDRVCLAGAVPYERLLEYINCMDVGVAPSQTTPRWKEQFGRAIVELMSCEVPVIGSDSGSIPEVIGENASLFPEQNVSDALVCLRRLIASDEERVRLGRSGRERVVALYSTEVMGACFLEMYRQLGEHWAK